MLLLPQKWLYGYMLSIDGVLQGLLYNVNLMTCMDFYDFLNQAHSVSLGGGLKLLEIHMRYEVQYIYYVSTDQEFSR